MGMPQNEPFHLAYQLDRGGLERRYDQFDDTRNYSNYKPKSNNEDEDDNDACCSCCCSLKMSCLIIGWLKIIVVLLFILLIIINFLITQKQRVKQPLYLNFFEITAIAILIWDLIVDIILLVGVYKKKIGNLNIFVGINGAFIILAFFFVLKNIIFEGPQDELCSMIFGMSLLLACIIDVHMYVRKLVKRARKPPATVNHLPYEISA